MDHRDFSRAYGGRNYQTINPGWLGDAEKRRPSRYGAWYPVRHPERSDWCVHGRIADRDRRRRDAASLRLTFGMALRNLARLALFRMLIAEE